MPSSFPKFSRPSVVLVALVACGGESPSPRTPEAGPQLAGTPTDRNASRAIEPATCPAATLIGVSGVTVWAEVFPLEAGGSAFVLEGSDAELEGARTLGVVQTKAVRCADGTVWWVPGVECTVSREAIEKLVRGASLLVRRCFAPLSREAALEHCANGTFGPKACARIQEQLRGE